MRDRARRIAGLRGAITVVRRAIRANEIDIGRGHGFQRFLDENRARLARLEAQLDRARQTYVNGAPRWADDGRTLLDDRGRPVVRRDD
jgi:hypothetical protein